MLVNKLLRVPVPEVRRQSSVRPGNKWTARAGGTISKD
jgi:hypothetical protein